MTASSGFAGTRSTASAVRSVIRLALALAILSGCSKADEAMEELRRVKGIACRCKGEEVCRKLGADQLARWHRAYDKVDGTTAQAAKVQADLKAIDACLAATE